LGHRYVRWRPGGRRNAAAENANRQEG
jgi:hypothetical protein